jgi:hypothetical protein
VRLSACLGRNILAWQLRASAAQNAPLNTLENTQPQNARDNQAIARIAAKSDGQVFTTLPRKLFGPFPPA